MTSEMDADKVNNQKVRDKVKSAEYTVKRKEGAAAKSEV